MRISGTITIIAALLAVTACGSDPDATPPAPGDSSPGTTTPSTTTPGATTTSTTSPGPTGPSTTAPATATTGPGVVPETLPDLRYDPDVATAELDAARIRWADRNWQSYRFSYTPLCFCPRGEIEVDVIDGRVVNSSGDGLTLSIEGWFDEIEAAIGSAVDVRVTYDDWGYPTSLYIDVDERMADEEFGFEFVGFAHVPDAVRVFLTDEYPCGFGFQVANPDQSAALMIRIRDIDDAEAGPAAGSYDMADLAGQARFGTDLMANWCDDVIEEDEPEAEVVDRWTLVGGTLELIVDGRTATAKLTGLVALTSDGDEFPLGDVTITNEMWGFVAG